MCCISCHPEADSIRISPRRRSDIIYLPHPGHLYILLIPDDILPHLHQLDERKHHLVLGPARHLVSSLPYHFPLNRFPGIQLDMDTFKLEELSVEERAPA